MSDSLMPLFRAIAAGDANAGALLNATPTLARAALHVGATRADPETWFLDDIHHYAYAGDTALHIAAASHDVAMVRLLLSLSADPQARNRRRAVPLHYAADGNPAASRWSPESQAAVIAVLIAAGADPNAADTGGVTPLHRAARNRCAAAVAALLEGGADPTAKNKSGSTPSRLAGLSTGRGGSGSPEAKAEQAKIALLLAPYA